MIHFTVYGSPKPAGSKRAFVAGGRAIVVDANPASKPWKQQITETALAQVEAFDYPKPRYPDGPVVLRMRFTLRRPKAHYGTGANANVLKRDAPYFHTGKPDALKLARAVEDALSGVVYRDDGQTIVVAWKVYGTTEGVEVWAEAGDETWDVGEVLRSVPIGLTRA